MRNLVVITTVLFALGCSARGPSACPPVEIVLACADGKEVRASVGEPKQSNVGLAGEFIGAVLGAAL